MILLILDLEWSLYQSYKNPPAGAALPVAYILLDLVSLVHRVTNCNWEKLQFKDYLLKCLAFKFLDLICSVHIITFTIKKAIVTGVCFKS